MNLCHCTIIILKNQWKKFKFFSLSYYKYYHNRSYFPTTLLSAKHLFILLDTSSHFKSKPKTNALRPAPCIRFQACCRNASSVGISAVLIYILAASATLDSTKKKCFPFRTGGKELKNIFSLRPKQCSISFPHYQGQVRNKFLMAGYFPTASES